MTAVKCPVCGRMVSGMATACPECGRRFIEGAATSRKKESRGGMVLLIAGGLLMSVIGIPMCAGILPIEIGMAGVIVGLLLYVGAGPSKGDEPAKRPGPVPSLLIPPTPPLTPPSIRLSLRLPAH
jgi:hypothetical protein